MDHFQFVCDIGKINQVFSDSKSIERDITTLRALASQMGNMLENARIIITIKSKPTTATQFNSVKIRPFFKGN